MLKKECCIKCWNKFGKEGWSIGDEMWWKKGWINCPPEYIEKGEAWYRKITEQPPINCPFILEQTIY